jgi:beta-glucosidase
MKIAKFFPVALLFWLPAVPLSAQSSTPLTPEAKSSPAERADAIVSRMTLEEKLDYIGGSDGFYIRAIPRLDVPAFKMSDGPLGVRNYGPSTTMAAGIGLAATWNPALAKRVGAQIGADARARGVHFLLGPGVNIYRAPMNGRNFEYFGEDPFLASRMAVGYIEGVQSQGVSATVKHFMGNNSEYDRHNTDDVIDERTLREIYLPTFEAAVQEAHVGAVMDSYNLVNGEHMTQNEYINTEVLKKDWNFQGILMSDWTATYDAAAAANSGLDLEMPFGKFMNRENLLPAIHGGKVSEATIDDKVRRILYTAAEFGWLGRDQADLSIPRYSLEGRRVALDAACEAIVLLKNEHDVLPLSKAIPSIAVIGPDAYPAVPTGGGSARVLPFAATSFLEGVSDYLGSPVKVYYSPGIPTLSEMAAATDFSTAEANGQPGLVAEYFSTDDLSGTAIATRTDAHINFARNSDAPSFPADAASERWTGFYTPARADSYDIFVQSTGEAGGYYRLYVDGKLVLDSWTTAFATADYATLSLDPVPHKIVLEHRGRPGWLGLRLRLGIAGHEDVVAADAKALAAKADAVVVAVGFDAETESEGSDRTFRLPPGQEELIEAMAAANKKTIVVVTSGGGVDMNAWLDSVPALIEAWYPGQEGGHALAEILFGEVNPSGRLPVTFERHWEDNPVHDSYYPSPDAPVVAGTHRVVYKEGIFVGYRGYEHNGTKPLFPFGYGLSYTAFKFSNLEIAPPSFHGGGPVTVSFDITNTGKREGAEVAEVYVRDKHAKVERPEKELKGFAKLDLKPGETKRASVTLGPRAFSYYDVEKKQWTADPGDFGILVGSSSATIELSGKVALTP